MFAICSFQDRKIPACFAASSHIRRAPSRFWNFLRPSMLFPPNHPRVARSPADGHRNIRLPFILRRIGWRRKNKGEKDAFVSGDALWNCRAGGRDAAGGCARRLRPWPHPGGACPSSRARGWCRPGSERRSSPGSWEKSASISKIRSYPWVMAHLKPVTYARPRPPLPGLWIAWMRASAAAIASTTCPVPSGELSSMTNTSASGATA